MKKSIYITAGIFILAPITISATTLTDCKTKCGSTTTKYCGCNDKAGCLETTDCSHNAYISESACKKANPGKTCSRASQTYRTLTCYACESEELKNLYPSDKQQTCGNGGPTSDEYGYRSYSITCDADYLGTMNVTCFLPD